jgi:Tfp pilus assembly protein PilN
MHTSINTNLYPLKRISHQKQKCLCLIITMLAILASALILRAITQPLQATLDEIQKTLILQHKKLNAIHLPAHFSQLTQHNQATRQALQQQRQQIHFLNQIERACNKPIRLNTISMKENMWEINGSSKTLLSINRLNQALHAQLINIEENRDAASYQFTLNIQK